MVRENKDIEVTQVMTYFLILGTRYNRHNRSTILVTARSWRSVPSILVGWPLGCGVGPPATELGLGAGVISSSASDSTAVSLTGEVAVSLATSGNYG